MPLLRDLRYALRSLRQSPALTATAILSLALSIGVNISVYSVARELILDDLSARQPDRLVRLGAPVTIATWRDLRRAEVFHDLACDSGLGTSPWSVDEHTEIAWGMTTSANFFDLLGVCSSTGRLYSQSDEGRPVAVLSYGFWRRRLHADPAAIGRTIQIDSKLYTVLGVLPRDYRSILRHGVSPEVYLLRDRDTGRCTPLGRLRDGFTRDQTRQALTALAQHLDGDEFATRVSTLRPMAGWAANAGALGDDHRYFIFFVMLYGTAFLLALIGCFNVAGLLLARGVTRQRELSIRKALGGGRYQIACHILAEGLVLVVLGAAAALLIDAAVRDRLSYIRWPSAYNLPFEFHFQADRGLLAYAVATVLAALLACSLIPALRGSNADLSLALKQTEPAFSLRRWNLRNAFVTLQVILSMVLLMMGALFSRASNQLTHADPGFNLSNTVMTTVWQHGRTEAVVRRLREVPGVLGVASIGMLPLMGELPQQPVRPQGDPVSAARDAYSMGAGDQFCRVLGIPVLRGRDFDAADRARQPVPALVNQALAYRLFGDRNPVGAALLVGRGSERTFEIVGVVGDARLRTLGEAHAPMFFTPYDDTQMIVRTAGDAIHWIAPIRTALAQSEPTSALDVRPLSEAAAGALFPMRVAAAFVGAMSAIGLLLAVSGLYSSISYATRRRHREIAIRIAVGATRPDILRTAIADGVSVLTLGVAIALPLAVAAIRPLATILPDGLDPWSPAMFTAVAALLLSTGAIAAWIAIRKPSNVDPATVLRQD